MVLHPVPEVTLQFKNIKFSVDLKRDGKKVEKKILQDISGMVRPGEAVIIMGPTGGGKTSMLDAIAGKIGSGNISGDVYLNGKPRDKYFKRYAAYVQQFDALPAMLSVNEVLQYSTNLTLGPEVTAAEKQTLIEDVVDELGLDAVRNDRIGSAVIPGIAAGQKKRLSMAIELVTRPSVLFLDEPTTGQDAAAAYGIMSLIKNLGKKGRTVLATIHQPSFAMYELFDKILLLSQGRLVYTGPATEAFDFFAKVGYPVPNQVNPTDHYMDVINVDYEGELGKIDVDAIVAEFRKSDGYKAICDTPVMAAQAGEDYDRVFATGFLSQSATLLKRTADVALRDPFIYWARVIAYTGMGLMIGLLYLQTPRDTQHIRDIISVIFFVAAFFSFMAVAAIPAFGEEREIFVRERGNGTYRVLCYVIANTLVAGPFNLLIAIASSAPLYWMVGLNPAVESFGFFVATLFLTLFTSESMMLMFSAVIPSSIANIAVSACFMAIFMLLCGFFIKLVNIPAGWAWASNISLHRYAFDSFMYNEFAGECFPPTNTTLLVPNWEVNCTSPALSGDKFIASSFDITSDNRVVDLVVILGIAMFFRVVYFFLLYFFQTGRK